MTRRTSRTLGLVLAIGLPAAAAPGFDLQGHRGARGLAPENTLAGFERALAIGVTTLELLDLGMTRDGVLVVSHDPALNPDLTRDPSGAWLEKTGPLLLSLELDRLRRYDVGRLRPGSVYAARFPEQVPFDGARIPTFGEVLALAAQPAARHVRLNVETKLDPRHPVAWTVNEPARMAELVALDVDGLITDYPDRLRELMAEKGLPLPPVVAP